MKVPKLSRKKHLSRIKASLGKHWVSFRKQAMPLASATGDCIFAAACEFAGAYLGLLAPWLGFVELLRA
jgi:hypothetical protein